MGDIVPASGANRSQLKCSQFLEAQPGRAFFWRLEPELWSLCLGHCSTGPPSGFSGHSLVILSNIWYSKFTSVPYGK